MDLAMFHCIAYFHKLYVINNVLKKMNNLQLSSSS